MKPHSVGRTLGIGLRVAGKIAMDRAEQGAKTAHEAAPAVLATVAEARAKEAELKSRMVAGARAGSRSFFAPFVRVTRSLWHEVTGVFFALFVLFFGNSAWKNHASWQAGPDHQRFVLAAVLTSVFLYLTVSAFWRAQK